MGAHLLDKNQSFFGFYVNSWGRTKVKNKDRVGAEATARFLCITEKNSLSEVREIAYTEANHVLRP